MGVAVAARLRPNGYATDTFSMHGCRIDPTMGKRILLVARDEGVAEPVSKALRESGMEVFPAERGDTALLDLARRRPDLVIADAGLPDLAGNELLRRIRNDVRTAELPVMLISDRKEEIDRVVAFEIGADDYVTKPFSAREVALRALALMRRTSRNGETRHATRVTTGKLEVDLDAHRVRIDGHAVSLSLIEFRLLAYLAQNLDHVQTRDALLEHVWKETDPLETRKVDTHVKRLRRKLGAASRHIETVRGVGYRLRRSAFDDP